MEKLLYNRKEAAALLSVSIQSLDKLVHCGDLGCVRVGKRLLTPPESLPGFHATKTPGRRAKDGAPMTIPKPFLAHDVKARANFLDIVSQYTSLRRVGKQYVGLCPFHKERHPSFYIHPEKKIFYCFGCGAGGDVFTFVMRILGCDFRHALESVARFSEGVARASDRRSRSRSGVSKGGVSPLSPPKAGVVYSQSLSERRAEIIASLEATDRRLRIIQATNQAASAALATLCEPRCADAEPFTCQKPDNCS